MFGIGCYKYAYGDIHFGEFQNGNFNGVGFFYTNSDGDVYTGEHQKDLRHGLGQLLKAVGTLYAGTFIEGPFMKPSIANDHPRSNEGLQYFQYCQILPIFSLITLLESRGYVESTHSNGNSIILSCDYWYLFILHSLSVMIYYHDVICSVLL